MQPVLLMMIALRERQTLLPLSPNTRQLFTNAIQYIIMTQREVAVTFSQWYAYKHTRLFGRARMNCRRKTRKSKVDIC